VFAFHRAETFAKWLEDEQRAAGSILRARLRAIPPLIEEDLRAIQIRAMRRLEESLAAGHPRALIQMASGSGKTFTACNFSYRLIKRASAQRILFLVDRNKDLQPLLDELNEALAA
jgi:type I restriction enzyme R subunit